jgi:hypothetical protein
LVIRPPDIHAFFESPTTKQQTKSPVGGWAQHHLDKAAHKLSSKMEVCGLNTHPPDIAEALVQSLPFN